MPLVDASGMETPVLGELIILPKQGRHRAIATVSSTGTEVDQGVVLAAPEQDAYAPVIALPLAAIHFDRVNGYWVPITMKRRLVVTP